MGLTDTFRKAAQTAVKAFGDVPSVAVYTAVGSSVYNASAGTFTTADSSHAGVKLVIEEFRFEQVDGEAIKPDDRRFLIPSRYMPSVVPKPNDKVRIGTDTWHVVNVATDPASALWDLQVRRP